MAALPFLSPGERQFRDLIITGLIQKLFPRSEHSPGFPMDRSPGDRQQRPGRQQPGESTGALRPPGPPQSPVSSETRGLRSPEASPPAAFIDFWPPWVFVAAHGLSLVVACRLLTAVASLVERRLQGAQAP